MPVTSARAMRGRVRQPRGVQAPRLRGSASSNRILQDRNLWAIQAFSTVTYPLFSASYPGMTVSRPLPSGLHRTSHPTQPAPVSPSSVDVLGVPLSVTDYDDTVAWIDASVAHREKGYVCVAATHTIMVCNEDPELREAVLGASMTVPDGQPLVWAMNALGGGVLEQ